MAEEEGNKQAAIASDGGINQKQWMNEPDFGAPTSPPPRPALSLETIQDLTKPQGSSSISDLEFLQRPKYTHPSQFRELGGQIVSTPEQRRATTQALQLAEMYPDAGDDWREIAAVSAIGDRDILQPLDIQQAEDPSFWESVGTFFEPFTTPQRAVWYAGLKAGEWLPDPGTAAGDLTQDVVGAVGGAMLWAGTGLIESPFLLWDAVFGEDDDEKKVGAGPSDARSTAEEFTLTFSDMVENLYGDISTGELAERAERHMRPWLWFDWTMAPAPTGDMILDSLLPYDAAEHLSMHGETAQHRKFGSWLSNDMGRLLIGVGLEITADPLWFAGPKMKAGNLVAHGDDAYRLGNALVKAAGNMEIIDRAGTGIKDFQRVMVELMTGSTDEIARAEKVIAKYSDMAFTDAEHRRLVLQSVNEALTSNDPEKLRKAVRAIADDRVDQANLINSKFADLTTDAGKAQAAGRAKEVEVLRDSYYALAEKPQEALSWLQKQQKTIPLEARNSERIAENLKDTLSYASDARSAGPKAVKQGVRKEGGLSWHVPFTDIGGSLNVNPIGRAGELLRRVGPIDTAFDNIADYSFSALSTEVQAAIKAHGNSVSALDAFDGNSTKVLAWTMQNLASKPLVISMAGWDMLRRAFGTRFAQPMTRSLQLNLIENYSTLPSFSFGMTTIRKLKKAHPQVWEKYQDGLTEMMQAYAGMETNLRTTTMRLMATAEKVLKERRVNSASEVSRLVELRKVATNPDKIADLDFQIDAAKRWANKSEYSITNIMNEAGDAIETSAGGYNRLSDDTKAVADGLREIINKIVNDPNVAAGKVTVEQALVQMARLAKGSVEERGQILADLKAIDQTLSNLNFKKDKLMRKTKKIFQKRIVQIRTLETMVDTMSVSKLVESLLAGQKAGSPELFYEDLVKIFGTEASANSVLRNTAIAMGTSDGYTAMRLFAEQVTGVLPRVKIDDPVELRKAIGIAIRDHLDELQKEADILRNEWIGGRLDKKGVKKADIRGNEFIPGMKPEQFNVIVKSMIEREAASWKLLVPEGERKAFFKWADQSESDQGRLLVSLTAEAPEGGSLKWNQAYGFYRREIGLRDVQKVARRWRSKGFTSRDEVYETIVPYASRYAREEAYRLADRAEEFGAVVPKGYVSPSPWRTGKNIQGELGFGLGPTKTIADLPGGEQKTAAIRLGLDRARREKAAAEAVIAASTDEAVKAAARVDADAAALAEKEWLSLGKQKQIKTTDRLPAHIKDGKKRRDRVNKEERKRLGKRKSDVGGLTLAQLEDKIIELGTVKKVAEWLSKTLDDKALVHILKKIMPNISDESFIFINHTNKTPKSSLHPDKRITAGARGVSGPIAVNVTPEGTLVPGTGFTISEIHLRSFSNSMFGQHGIEAETIVHEILHNATSMRIRAGLKLENKNSHMATYVTELKTLTRLVQNSKHTKGLLPSDFNPHELISWGLTNKAVRDALKKIPYEKQTAWTKFVEVMAKFLGMNKVDENALTAVLRLTESVIDAPTEGLRNHYGRVGAENPLPIFRTEIPFEPFVPAAGKKGKTKFKPHSPEVARNIKVGTDRVSKGLLGVEGRLGLSEKYQKEFRKQIERIKKDLDPEKLRQAPDPDGLINDVVGVLERLATRRSSPFSTLDEVEDLEFLLRDLNEYSKINGIGRQFKPSKDLASAAAKLVRSLNGIRKTTDHLDFFHKDMIRILNGLLSGGNDVVLDGLKSINKTYGKRIQTILPSEKAGEAIRRVPLGPKGITADSLRSRSLAEMAENMTYDKFMDTMTTLLSRQRVMDPELKALLSTVAKKAKVKRSVSRITSDTLAADVQKIKSDMLDVLNTGGKGKKAGPLIKDVRKQAALAKKKINDQHGRITEEMSKEFEDLRDRLDQFARPKFPPSVIEDGTKFDGRDFEVWENKLWDDYSMLVAKHGLSVEDQLFAAFSVLREMPRGISKEMRSGILEKYPSVMGRRFGDVSSDLEPVMSELTKLIKTYEVEYSKRGLSFMRNKVEMMQRWGVMEYVPHLYREMDEVGVTMAVFDKVSKGGGSTRGLEQLLTREMDASKKRGLAGSILELNSITRAKKGTTDIIALDPSLLWARYTQANHALTLRDFLTTLVATGVMKGIRAGDKSLGVAVERTPGVLKSVQELAEELDMVPVFNRNYSTKEMELFINGSLEELTARFPSIEEGGMNVHRAIERLADELMEPPEKGFASYVQGSIEIKNTLKTEQALLRLRSQQAKLGQEPYNAIEVFNTRYKKGLAEWNKRWDADMGADLRAKDTGADVIEGLRKEAELKFESAFSNNIWDDIAEEVNTLTRKHTPNVSKVRGKYLSAYLDTDTKLWELHIPAVVRQNMGEVLEMDPKAVGGAKKMFEKVNNFWKTRVTVTAVAFSTRNWLANNVSMAFDLGPTGVLNLKTQRQGLRLANATRWVEQYGSLEKAWEAVNKTLPASAKTWEKTKQLAAKTLFRTSGMKSILENGFQLTDDFWMSADDLVKELVDRGVVSPAFTQVVDISMAEQRLLQKTFVGGAKGDALSASRSGKVLSAVEDALIVSVPTIMTGGVPLALPKKFGSEIVARTVENQARVFNFLANFKKTNSMTDATAHVNKFLFNYGDLTQVQKNWMRLLVPFFTWNQKNVALQFDLMRTSPQLYANFHRLMIDGVPQAMSASQSESAGDRFVDYDPLSKEKLRERETHYLHTIQLPMLSLENTALGNLSVPTLKMNRGKKGVKPWQNFDLQWGKLGKDYFPRLKNAQIQGLGLPQEALVNSMSLLMGAADLRNWPVVPLPGELGKQRQARAFSSRSRWTRFMGETHALLRLAVEVGTRQHQFFDKPINELTDGRLVAETIGAIRQVPFVGDTMADIMADRTGLKGYTVYDKYSKTWKNFVKVDGAANHIWGSLPWTRNLRDAAAMTDEFLLSKTIPWDQLAGEGIVADEIQELPVMYSVLDAGTGIRIKQSDPALMRAYSDRRLQKQYEEYLNTIGLLKTWQKSYVPFKD